MEVVTMSVDDEIMELEMENMDLRQRVAYLERLIARSYEWLGVRAPGGVGGVTKKYATIQKENAAIVREWKRNNEGLIP